MFEITDWSDIQGEPKIRYSLDMKDDMRVVRWRATWDRSYDGSVIGVLVEPFPVVRNTEHGAWVDPYAYWHGEWNFSEKRCHKWMRNDSGQAWAKPTKESAIESLIYRHERWASRIANDVIYFHKVTAVLARLFPDKERQAKDAFRLINLAAQKGTR